MLLTPQNVAKSLFLLGVTCVVLGTAHSLSQKQVLTSLSAPEAHTAPSPSPVTTKKVATAMKRSRNALVAQVTAPSFSVRPVLKQADIHENQQIIAEEVLRKMPTKCNDVLKHFFVRYDNPQNRGLAGKDTIILTGNVGDDEFRALMVHEYGHVMDLGCMRGTSSAAPSAFRDGNEVIYSDDPSALFYAISWSNEKTRNSGSKPEDFVSGYAQWDPFEDFAETTAAYVLHTDALKEAAKKNPVLAQKVQWMETYLFPVAPTVATSTYTWPSTKRPWDITKLSYAWNKESVSL